MITLVFPISRDPPEGGTSLSAMVLLPSPSLLFPISRDPPEGGTRARGNQGGFRVQFPISRDPPEGGTAQVRQGRHVNGADVSNF